MKTILSKLVTFFLLSVLLFFIYLLIFANGKADQYYLRFTSPKQSSLILGSSRAAQGILPSVFNNSKLNFSRNLYNFSFTINDSRFGAIYLNAIKKKLDTTKTNGLFILEVNPLSIACGIGNKNDDPKYFRENGNFLHLLKNMNINPNIEYLSKYIGTPYIRMFIYNILSKFKIHTDGWIEISVPMDSTSVKFRKQIKFNKYKVHFASNKYSQNRINALDKTIKYLSSFGTVIIVRLPVDTIMLNMENNFMPDFSEKILNLSNLNNTPFIDLTYMNKTIITTDGNHLYKEDAIIVSKEIMKFILQKNNSWK